MRLIANNSIAVDVQKNVMSLAFSWQGDYLAVGGARGGESSSVWVLQRNGQRWSEMPPLQTQLPVPAAADVALNAAGDVLTIGMYPRGLVVFQRSSADRWVQLSPLLQPQSPLSLSAPLVPWAAQVSMSADGSIVAYGGSVDMTTTELAWVGKIQTDRVACLTCSPNGCLSDGVNDCAYTGYGYWCSAEVGELRAPCGYTPPSSTGTDGGGALEGSTGESTGDGSATQGSTGVSHTPGDGSSGSNGAPAASTADVYYSASGSFFIDAECTEVSSEEQPACSLAARRTVSNSLFVCSSLLSAQPSGEFRNVPADVCKSVHVSTAVSGNLTVVHSLYAEMACSQYGVSTVALYSTGGCEGARVARSAAPGGNGACVPLVGEDEQTPYAYVVVLCSAGAIHQPMVEVALMLIAFFVAQKAVQQVA